MQVLQNNLLRWVNWSCTYTYIHTYSVLQLINFLAWKREILLIASEYLDCSVSLPGTAASFPWSCFVCCRRDFDDVTARRRGSTSVLRAPSSFQDALDQCCKHCLNIVSSLGTRFNVLDLYLLRCLLK